MADAGNLFPEHFRVHVLRSNDLAEPTLIGILIDGVGKPDIWNLSFDLARELSAELTKALRDAEQHERRVEIIDYVREHGSLEPGGVSVLGFDEEAFDALVAEGWLVRLEVQGGWPIVTLPDVTAD